MPSRPRCATSSSVDAARRRRGPAKRQRGARRRVDLAAVVHLDDLDVPVRAEPRRDLLDQAEQQVDAEAGIGRPDDRHPLGRRAHRAVSARRQPGRADHHRRAVLGRERGVRRGRGGEAELDRDIAVAHQLARIARRPRARSGRSRPVRRDPAPSMALPGRAVPPASSQPSAAAISAISMRPIRPPHPMTPILISAMPASRIAHRTAMSLQRSDAIRLPQSVIGGTIASPTMRSSQWQTCASRPFSSPAIFLYTGAAWLCSARSRRSAPRRW